MECLVRSPKKTHAWQQLCGFWIKQAWIYLRILIFVYCKALVEIYALKVKPCFCRYLWCARTRIPDGMGAWRGRATNRAGVQDLPFTPYPAVCECFGSPKTPDCRAWVRYHCEGNAACLGCRGLDLPLHGPAEGF